MVNPKIKRSFLKKSVRKKPILKIAPRNKEEINEEINRLRERQRRSLKPGLDLLSLERLELHHISRELVAKIDAIIEKNPNTIPIIILPDTSMRMATYFFTAFLIERYPEIYRPLKIKYNIGPCVHVMNFRFNDKIPEIPNIFRNIPNVKPIILDYVASDPNSKKSTINKISSELQQSFGLNAEYMHVSEALFNVHKAGYMVLDGLKGRGRVLKDNKTGEVKFVKKEDYVRAGRLDMWQKEQEKRSRLFELGLDMGIDFRIEQLFDMKERLL